MAAPGRAVWLRGAGGPEVLEIDALEVPEPGLGQALVEVVAAGLNRADLLQRRGLYPAPPGSPPDIPGLELAGTVAAVGAGVTEVEPGDRVMAITGGGAMATHAVLPARELVAVPERLSLIEAAAVPEVFFTAYDALFRQARLGPGEVVLIHAAASGIGTAAIQLAARAGAVVAGTSRTGDKLERCVELGLEHPILVEGGRFAEAARRAAGGRGVDVVLDTVGGAYLGENLAAMASGGRLIVIGLLGGPVAQANLGALLSKRLTLIGSVLRPRPHEEKAALAQEIGRRLVPMFSAGALRPVIDDVLPMSEIRAAHQRLEDNATIGKLVLRW
jgi:putative PIG3 family NAD(P)H quinone oxidoreductase